MITFKKKDSKKKSSIFLGDEEILILDFIPSSITNKFSVVSDFVEDMSKMLGEEFDNWFVKFLKDYVAIEPQDIEVTDTVDPNTPTKFLVFYENIDSLIYFVNKYIDSLKIDFSDFVDEKKVKKNSILFTPEEIKIITRLAGYLKIYSIFFNSENLRLDERLHRKIHSKLSEEISETEIIDKIFNIIKTRTFRYNMTDKYMWDYIKMVQCKSIDVHVIEIFNFIMNSIIVLCEPNKNPITYFIGVIEESVKWFLRSVYKGSIIYDDSISTEDIQGINVDNLKTYCYNDTLGRLKNIAYEKVYNLINIDDTIDVNNESKSDLELTNVCSRLREIKYISPICEFLVFPVLSKVTEIPYDHFKTISPEHSAVLSIYVQDLLNKVFNGEFQNLFKLLSYYPGDQPIQVTTYKLKALNGENGFVNIQNNLNNFFGFKTKILCGKILSTFVGRIPRSNFINTITGKSLGGIPTGKLEVEIIKFYSYLFSGNLEPYFKQMKKLVNDSF